MFRILILLVLGVGVGYMLRGRSFVGVTKWSIQITVCVLLFVFGVSIGSDRNLVDNFLQFRLASGCNCLPRCAWEYCGRSCSSTFVF